MEMLYSLRTKKLKEKIKRLSSLCGLDDIVCNPLNTIVGEITDNRVYLDKIIEPFLKLIDDLCIHLTKRFREKDTYRADKFVYLFQDMRMNLLNYKMIPYFDFGEDSKYLKDVKIEFVYSSKMPIDNAAGCYMPEERKIYIDERFSEDKDIIAHEQSHAISYIKFRIREEIESIIIKKYKNVCEDILGDILDRMQDTIKKKVDEAEEKLRRLGKEKDSIPFEEKCLLYARIHSSLIRLHNKILMYLEKELEKMYGNKVREFIHLYHEIRGADELLAHAVEREVMNTGYTVYYVLYLFEGSITIYRIWKMLNEMGYPEVSNKLLYKRVKRAKELVEKI